jgi:hypothetical protein
MKVFERPSRRTLHSKSLSSLRWLLIVIVHRRYINLIRWCFATVRRVAVQDSFVFCQTVAADPRLKYKTAMFTALMIAAFHGHLGAVTILIAAGPDINHRDSDVRIAVCRRWVHALTVVPSSAHMLCVGGVYLRCDCW